MFGNEDATDTLSDLMTDDYAVFEKIPNHHDANGVMSGKLNMCLGYEESTGPMEIAQKETKDGTAP